MQRNLKVQKTLKYLKANRAEKLLQLLFFFVFPSQDSKLYSKEFLRGKGKLEMTLLFVEKFKFESRG